jgi:hypothetical protein
VKNLLIAAAAIALAPAAASAADMSGVWVVNADFGGAITYTTTCTLKDDAGALTGSCTDPQGGAVVNTTGKVTESATDPSMEWAYDTTYQGAPIHLDYKGDVQADGTLKGTIDAGGPQGTFTAKKN